MGSEKIRDFLIGVFVFIVVIVAAMNKAEFLNTTLQSALRPLVDEASNRWLLFYTAMIGMLILALGFIFGVITSYIKHSAHLAEFNGIYMLKCEGEKRAVHIVYVWNKPPFALNGYKRKIIYCKYYQEKPFAPDAKIESFQYGLSLRDESIDSNNANVAYLVGEGTGLKVYIELDRNKEDARYSKVSIDILEVKKRTHISQEKVKNRKGDQKELSSLNGGAFNHRFEQAMTYIVSRMSEPEEAATCIVQTNNVVDGISKGDS